MIRFEIPLKTPSTANLREHWAARAKRTKAQRAATARLCPPWNGPPLLVVRLTRISPRMLDRGDNLPMSLKACRDSIASWLRVDDRTPLVRWEYEQLKGPKPLVRVEVERTPPEECMERSEQLAEAPSGSLRGSHALVSGWRTLAKPASYGPGGTP